MIKKSKRIVVARKNKNRKHVAVARKDKNSRHMAVTRKDKHGKYFISVICSKKLKLNVNNFTLLWSNVNCKACLRYKEKGGYDGEMPEV